MELAEATRFLGMQIRKTGFAKAWGSCIGVRSLQWLHGNGRHNPSYFDRLNVAWVPGLLAICLSVRPVPSRSALSSPSQAAISPSYCPDVCLIIESICLPMCFSNYLFMGMPTCLSVNLSIYLPISLSIHLSIYQTISLSICLSKSVYISICLIVCVTISDLMCKKYRQNCKRSPGDGAKTASSGGFARLGQKSVSKGGARRNTSVLKMYTIECATLSHRILLFCTLCTLVSVAHPFPKIDRQPWAPSGFSPTMGQTERALNLASYFRSFAKPNKRWKAPRLLKFANLKLTVWISCIYIYNFKEFPLQILAPTCAGLNHNCAPDDNQLYVKDKTILKYWKSFSHVVF